MARWALYILAALAVGASAQAATVSVALHDSHGAPASNAVLTLTPTAGLALAPQLPEQATIDQRDQMFMPLVVALRRGGNVVFANNDNTMHQVYSFSAIKQFEAEIERGQRSRPIVFDKAGVAVIGCNIHDNMIAYVFVSDAPIGGLTDPAGEAKLRDVPPGAYKVAIWHPRMPPGQPPVVLDVTVGTADIRLARSLSLLSDKSASMHGQHKQSY
jgi:plastocyanin